MIDVLVALAGGRLRFIVAGAPVVASWFAGALAGRHATLITAGELAMTADEVADEYANWGEQLNATDAAAVAASSHGWPVAVRLQRLSGGTRRVGSPSPGDREAGRDPTTCSRPTSPITFSRPCVRNSPTLSSRPPPVPS
ncbi:hypothetical protein G7085_18605 [Tessaracoccus sp. HDW20]|uniref:hypothetical protein n=1 Tax=Tessaracoccus coleopterorum TaxID=2714950 RepID=UPI0018D388DB|nr:hypothetical protein [Tessaracoccus coleopterorum]NHB85883.1 hypothetical protein [Tessaracoccus coleopterorum]